MRKKILQRKRGKIRYGSCNVHFGWLSDIWDRQRRLCCRRLQTTSKLSRTASSLNLTIQMLGQCVLVTEILHFFVVLAMNTASRDVSAVSLVWWETICRSHFTRLRNGLVLISWQPLSNRSAIFCILVTKENNAQTSITRKLLHGRWLSCTRTGFIVSQFSSATATELLPRLFNFLMHNYSQQPWSILRLPFPLVCLTTSINWLFHQRNLTWLCG